MINNLKQKIISIYLSRKKLFNFIGIFLTVLLLIVYFLTHKDTAPSNITPIPTNSNQSSKNPASTKPYTFNENEEYFINQIVTNYPPVTGYSWSGNKLIYSNSKGIYEAGTNNTVLIAPIDQIKWADYFNVLIKSDGKWSKLNYADKKMDEVVQTLNNPIINRTGLRIADFQKNIVILYNLDDNTNSKATLTESVENVFFVPNSKEIVVSTFFGSKTFVYKLDEKLNIIKSFSFDDSYHLSSISQDGEGFVLILKNKLIVANFSGILSTNIF